MDVRQLVDAKWSLALVLVVVVVLVLGLAGTAWQVYALQRRHERRCCTATGVARDLDKPVSLTRMRARDATILAQDSAPLLLCPGRMRWSA